jgi:hypothetical protein
MLKDFNLAALTEFDSGRLRLAIDQAIDQARRDAIERPQLRKARKVTIALSFTPVASPEGDVQSIKFGASIIPSLPKREADGYSLLPVKGGMVFNDLSLENVQQMTIDQAGPKSTERKKA